jgi:4-amino-4-deoxy-L-arabinose transferase-like glycosyltransferase
MYSFMKETSSAQTKKPVGAVLALVLLLAVGAALRFPYLSHFPMQVHNDESSSAVEGISQFVRGEGGWALYGAAFGGHPNLSFWLSAIPGRILGEFSLWTSRLGSALSGTLSLLFFALFMWQAFGRRLALFFLVFAVPFHFHAHFSRTAFPFVHALLMMSVVSFAFARFVRAPSVWRALLLGLGLGLAMLVYPATQVLPMAIFAAVVFSVAPTQIKERGAKAGLTRVGTLAAVCGVGAFVIMAPQLMYSYEHGFNSRLQQTLIFHEHNIKHLTPQTGDPNISVPGIVWFNFTSTLKFLYKSDSGEQYNFIEPPLPIWGDVLAIVGALILAWRCLKRDPISIYLMATAALTIISSALLVEANFSPHMTLFALLIPLAVAVGWDGVLRLASLRNATLVTVATLGIGAAWGDWNWRFYNSTVSPERSRITRPQTYLINLPTDPNSVRSVLNFSALDLGEGETYYPLIFPQAVVRRGVSNATSQQVLSMMNEYGCPCIITEESSKVERLKSDLVASGKTVELYRYPEMPVDYLVVDGTK